jgi:hypothetical protein
LYDVLYDFVGSPPQIREISGGGAKDRKSYWFRTYGHPYLSDIISPFYLFDNLNQKFIKIIPNNISDWFNECVLAYWFMDDGTLSSKGYIFYLNTQSFSFDDNLKLQSVLKSKLNINSHIVIDKKNNDINLYKLKIDKESNSLFIKLIEPYILPCFEYKLIIK